jgi:hypothetical protein
VTSDLEKCINSYKIDLMNPRLFSGWWSYFPLCYGNMSVLSPVRTSASVSDLLRYFCFLAYFVFYFAYSVDFLWSGKSGLFLINYISSGGILCRQFNISIHVGHVERHNQWDSAKLKYWIGKNVVETTLYRLCWWEPPRGTVTDSSKPL